MIFEVFEVLLFVRI